MFGDKRLKKEVRELKRELEEKKDKVTKYVAVTDYKGDVEAQVSRGGYFIGRETLKGAPTTLILVRRNGNVDTITVPGKWTIEQIKEAASE